MLCGFSSDTPLHLVYLPWLRQNLAFSWSCDLLNLFLLASNLLGGVCYGLSCVPLKQRTPNPGPQTVPVYDLLAAEPHIRRWVAGKWVQLHMYLQSLPIARITTWALPPVKSAVMKWAQIILKPSVAPSSSVEKLSSVKPVPGNKKVGDCCPESMLKSQPLTLVNMTLFGNKIFANVIHLRWVL